MDPLRVAILTVSDGVAAGTREDRSGAAIARWCADRGAMIVRRDTVSDDIVAIGRVLLACTDGAGIDLVLTTGGTGFTDRDITPEATHAVIERSVPGIAEAVRAHGAAATPFAWLSRGIAGIRGRTLIVNLPGRPKSIRENLEAVFPAIPYCIDLIGGPRLETHPQVMKAFRPGEGK